jgi:hypothetical protein
MNAPPSVFPPKHLIKLADFLGVPVSYFFPTTPCPGP